jgi:hypothetical protein
MTLPSLPSRGHHRDRRLQSHHHRGESRQIERLRPVRQRALRAWMNFDDDAVGADGHCRARGRGHKAAASRSMRRIDYNRQMA